MELKGIITNKLNIWGDKETVSLTCCASVPRIMIGEQDLHQYLTELFATDSEAEFNWGEEWEEKAKKHQIYMAIKYVILDEQPKEEQSFNDISALVINTMLHPEYVSGCYSEYTCGYGDFDFLTKEHSIFQELSEHEGKYIHLQINEIT